MANAQPGYMDVQALCTFGTWRSERSSELTSTVDLYLSGNREAALAVVRSGAGKRDMDELRRNTAAIEKNLDTAMAPVRRQVIVYRDIFFGLGLATLLFTIIGLSSLFFLVRRYGELRDQYDDKLQAANRDLENKVKLRTEELAAANRDLTEFARVAAHDLKAPIRTAAVLLVRSAASPWNPARGKELRPDRAQRSLKPAGAARQPPYLLPGWRSGARTNEAGASHRSRRYRHSNLPGNPLNPAAERLRFRPFPVVSGYAPLLTLVFQNLIENSLKYRKEVEVPRIVVESKQAADGTIVSVSDNGIGFDPQYKDSISCARVFTSRRSIRARASASPPARVSSNAMAAESGLIWFGWWGRRIPFNGRWLCRHESIAPAQPRQNSTATTA